MLRSLDLLFTKFALCADRHVNRHNLLDIPAGWPWRIFQTAVYCHITVTVVLIVAGISCFCTGIQNSFMYTNVNCSHGTSLTAPMVNLCVIFLGLIALRQPESYWGTFIHFTFAFVVGLMNLYFIIDMATVDPLRIDWSKHPRTRENWPMHFVWMDLIMIILLVFIECCCAVCVGMYITLKFDLLRWRRSPPNGRV
ncbi:hypothetical protein Ddc_07357 [Ditylenchus destructor]|nr:hypothetical protein Ddc_07357 [Ditylenchus destructor]